MKILKHEFSLTDKRQRKNILFSAESFDVVKIGEKVSNINWSRDIIEVTTKWGKYTANQVIVTVPLGVLKADHKNLFTPNLDEKKVKAINNLAMGCVGTIFLEWDQPWWSGNQVIFTSKLSMNTSISPDDV